MLATEVIYDIKHEKLFTSEFDQINQNYNYICVGSKSSLINANPTIVGVKNPNPAKVSRIGKQINNSTTNFSFVARETGFSGANSEINDIREMYELPELYETKSIKISTVITINNNEPLVKTVIVKIYGLLMPINLIKSCIDLFNRCFENDGESFRFSINIKNYKLKPSKKNGMPKSDYPAIDFKTSIKDTNIDHFSLIYDVNDLIKLPQTQKCQSCLLF